MKGSDPIKNSPTLPFSSLKQAPPLSHEEERTSLVFSHYPPCNELSLESSQLHSRGVSQLSVAGGERVEKKAFHPQNLHKMLLILVPKDQKRPQVLGFVSQLDSKQVNVLNKEFKEGRVRYFDTENKVLHLKKGENIDVKQLLLSEQMPHKLKEHFEGEITQEHHDQKAFDAMNEGVRSYMSAHGMSSEEEEEKNVKEAKTTQRDTGIRGSRNVRGREGRREATSPQALFIIQDIVFSMMHMSQKKFREKMEALEEEKIQESARVRHEEIKKKELQQEIQKKSLA